MAQVDTGEFPPAFKRVHGYAMIAATISIMIFGWGATWTNTQNRISETQNRISDIDSDVNGLREQSASQQKTINANQESLARIETSVQWIRETLASQKRNP
jgi:peptidoglycan hydrolase CwlO-like protein